MSANRRTLETYRGFIETTEDALIILEACRQRSLRRAMRRLNHSEGRNIESGAIYVFESRESGIRRWTDGRIWSPSRIADNFLVYREVDHKEPAPSSYSDYSYPMGSARGSLTKNEDAEPCGPLTSQKGTYYFKQNGLIKKTISVHLDGSQHQLICYYRKSDVINGKLVRPIEDPNLEHILIPDDLIDQPTFRKPQRYAVTRKERNDRPRFTPYGRAPSMDQRLKQAELMSSYGRDQPPRNTSQPSPGASSQGERDHAADYRRDFRPAYGNPHRYQQQQQQLVLHQQPIQQGTNVQQYQSEMGQKSTSFDNMARTAHILARLQTNHSPVSSAGSTRKLSPPPRSGENSFRGIRLPALKSEGVHQSSESLSSIAGEPFSAGSRIGSANSIVSLVDSSSANDTVGFDSSATSRRESTMENAPVDNTTRVNPTRVENLLCSEESYF